MIYALILLAGILYFFVALPGLWLLDHYGGNAGHLVIVSCACAGSVRTAASPPLRSCCGNGASKWRTKHRAPARPDAGIRRG